jgi:hypothetical protein
MSGPLAPTRQERTPGGNRAIAPLVSWVACGLLALLGLYFRFHGLTASLSLDEFGTFWVVERELATAIARSWAFQGQSPLYYVLSWASMHALGESEAAMRAPSLVLGGLLSAALYASGRLLSGPKAGMLAALMGWLLPAALRASVEARPYALSLFTVSVAVGAFLWTVRTGSRRARILWIVGGATVAWSHYVQYPLIAGLFIAYAVVPGLRAVYKVRRCAADGLWQLGLVSLCVPQVFTLFMRRESLSWIDQPERLVFLIPVLPLLPAIVAGEASGAGQGDPVLLAARRSLWIALLTHVVVLELAAAGGMSLLAPRYFLAIVVPAVLLSAVACTRGRPVEAAIGLLGFAIVAGGFTVVTRSATGTFSGLGFDDWRGAVAALSERLRGTTEPVVFYRSGFVEEDLAPLGRLPAATLAPLRSPGRSPVSWPVTSLTFRWSNPRREPYFKSRVAPRIRQSREFFLLTAKWSPENASYPEAFIAWVQREWPGRFQTVRRNFGTVEMLEFVPAAPR